MRRPAALAAVFVLSVAGMLGARAIGSGPALYDGVCLPVQYVPVGGNPPPASVKATVTPDATNSFPTTVLATNESTPQAQAIIGSGTFAASALPVTLSITPVSPPARLPTDGTIAGNVYRFTATARDGSALQPASGKPVTIVLEAPPSTGTDATIEAWDGTTWSPLATQGGNCAGTLFEAASPRLGDMALVKAGAPATGSPGGSVPTPSPPSGAPVALIVVAAVIVVAALVAAALRRRRPPRGR